MNQDASALIGGGLVLLRDPQFDPVTGRLYYLRVAPDDSQESTHGSVWSSETDGSDPRRVTALSEDVIAFRVAQTGGRICVVLRTSATPRLQVLTTEDFAFVVDVDLPGTLSGRPAWSREAELIAVSVLQLPVGRPAAQAAMSRAYKEDGTGFVGDARRQIWVLNVKNATWRQATHESVHCLDPEWSPSADIVAFRTQDPMSWPMAGVAEATPAGESVTLHTTPSMSLDAFVWSPDGENLLLVGDDAMPWANHGDLFVLRRHDGLISRLTQGSTWQPWVQGFHLSS